MSLQGTLEDVIAMTESETKRGEGRDQIPSGASTNRANVETKAFVLVDAEFKPDVQLQKAVAVEKSCEATSRVSLT